MDDLTDDPLDARIRLALSGLLVDFAPPSRADAPLRRAGAAPVRHLRSIATAVGLVALLAAGALIAVSTRGASPRSRVSEPGIGVRLADGDGNRSAAPARIAGIVLPIEYPVGEELQSLGDTPGPLAAIWLDPHADGGKPGLVGLVAETGTFGTLPIDLPDYPDDPENPMPSPEAAFELSPDGRRIAYYADNLSPAGQLVVRDLMSGEEYVSGFAFGIRGPEGWVDATHLLGRVADGSDADGWVWEPGTAPNRVDFYAVPYGESRLAVPVEGGGPWNCSSPVLQDVQKREQNGGDWEGAFTVPVLCDVLGITDSGTAFGHWKNRQDGNGTVVGLDIARADPPLGRLGRLARPDAAEFDDPALRRVVVTKGAPGRVSLATYLIEAALDADGGATRPGTPTSRGS